ncbi:MAG TPA: NUDIX domain-containing protein [Syntrophobacteria bacterium]|nr:NUDIX domain-containing protein [Syntrophobacteria bacterium]
MRHEVSAGVILFHSQPRREYLLLDYTSHWDFPKGHIEEGEDPYTTARRELQEETGIQDARFVSGYFQRMRYFYRRGGERMSKVVIYFLAETEAHEVTLSHEHSGYVWAPYERALQRLTFKSARELLKKAEEFLDDRSKIPPITKSSKN